jgi:hypothetical protein
MTPKFKSHLRNVDMQTQVMPRESAWLKLESKLQASKHTDHKIRKYRSISIAAIMIAVAACMTIFYIQKDIAPVNDNFAFQVDSDIWPNVPESNLYNIAQLRDLKAAYSKHNIKKRI